MNTKLVRVLAVILILALALGSVSAVGAAGPPPMAKVLIAFDRQPGPAEEALVRGAGGAIKYTYHLVPAIAATLPEAAIEGLSRNPRVVRIEPDIEVYAVEDYVGELDNTWGVKRIGAGTVHAGGYLGTGVKVAIIDSGVDYTHPDLGGCFGANCRVAGGWDFVNNDNDPMDDNGHGTHVAGTVAASRNGVGVVGVAPEAKLYALKVLGADGSGSYSNVIAALQWAVDNAIQITNNSYGSSGDPGVTVKAAFDSAYVEGILNVCAAGNSGRVSGSGDNVIYPARWDSCIAVAATDQSDKRASWSSTGPTVELAAPGVDINSTLIGGGYGIKSGTSMASPHVAGTAALVWAANPGWSNDQVRTQLQTTAVDLGAAGRDPQYGYGLVDADEVAPPIDTTPPVADDNTVSTDEDTPVEITLSGSDEETCELSFSIVRGPSNGTLSVIADQSCTSGTPNMDRALVTYTPNADYNGSDSFAYRVTDAEGASDDGTLAITVNAVNDAPVANDDSATTQVDTDVTIDVLANDSDVDGDSLTVTNLTQPSSGSVTLNLNTVTYTPGSGFTGDDSFTYTANDGMVDSNVATVTVTVDNSTPDTMHVGDLDGASSSVGRNWKATVTATIHDANHDLVPNATVYGTWSGSYAGTASCVTGADGKCSVSTGPIKNGTVTFRVDNVTHATLSYVPADNHNPDGDISDGTSITVSK